MYRIFGKYRNRNEGNVWSFESASVERVSTEPNVNGYDSLSVKQHRRQTSLYKDGFLQGLSIGVCQPTIKRIITF